MSQQNLPVDWIVPTFDIISWEGVHQPWCVIIPVINEGIRIQTLLARMMSCHIPTMADILIVDGGSTDDSLNLPLLKQYQVRALIVKTGPGGLSAQLRCAYAFALQQGYQGLITIDGNNKDDPSAIPHFIQAFNQGWDFVQASRFISGGYEENTPLIRKLAIRLVHAPLLRLFSGFKWTDTTQGFRGYRRSLLLDPRIAPFRDIFMTYELLAYLSYRAPKVGYRCVEIPTQRCYPSGKVPTKIKGIRGELALLRILITACIGRYNPLSQSFNRTGQPDGV